MFQKLTQEEFLAKAEQVHGDKYDYSRANYLGGKVKITIGCPVHGFFEQKATLHLMGRGCLDCGNGKSGKTRSLTSEKFIERATARYGDKYDYSMVSCVNKKTPVIVACYEHGSFLITPEEHIRRGMPCCNSENRRSKFREKYLNVFALRHGDKYDYSQAHFFNARTPVTVICKKHGSFEVSPYNHGVKGFGCKSCGLFTIVK